MTDERVKEIIDDITNNRAIKLTEEESAQISYRRLSIPPYDKSVVLTIKRK